MINKRLIKMVPNTMKHVKINIGLQIGSLLCNILLMYGITILLSKTISNDLDNNDILFYFISIVSLIILRICFMFLANKQSYLASKSVKEILREKIYMKITSLVERYKEKISTAELLQLAVEGIDQLEIYFSNYLPQFFYAMIAPLILFVIFMFISIKVAIVLFICVPLIPVSIIIIQKIAKKLLGKYWGEYSALADNFLENIQGLNTMKIYQSDEYKHKQMNIQAERFRVVTMKVLSMQLNSIIVMDIVAYGGAAIGIVLSILEYSNGYISIQQALFMILLSVDFFLPLRILGSYFHIAMNGIAASKKIFNLIDMEDLKEGNASMQDSSIILENLSFGYGNKNVLDNISINIENNQFVSIVGESGCGKSTIAKILKKINSNYSGSILVGNGELKNIASKNIHKKITMVTTNGYIFKGSVRDNLLMANANATDEELWNILKQVNLDSFLNDNQGLDTLLEEKGNNFSGGQRQRLVLARALVHDSDIYIFDEATSNIDVESENSILEVIHRLKKTKTIIMISHRLANIVDSDNIYVLEGGKVVESGTHSMLLNNKQTYLKMWNMQKELEEVSYGTK